MYTVDTVYLDCWFVVCNELPEVTNIWLSQRGMNYCKLDQSPKIRKVRFIKISYLNIHSLGPAGPAQQFSAAYEVLYVSAVICRTPGTRIAKDRAHRPFTKSGRDLARCCGVESAA